MFDSPSKGQVAEPTGPLAIALLNEHHEIDAGIEAFAARAEQPDGESAGALPSESADASIEAWAAPLLGAMEALRRHIYLEEVLVFPKLRTGPLMMAIMVMIREHGELWRAMDGLDHMLESEGAAPAGDPTYRNELIAACREMLSLLDDHNMKEEPVIYPHIDDDLDGPTQRQLGAFLEEGSMPEGWVCEAAR